MIFKIEKITKIRPGVTEILAKTRCHSSSKNVENRLPASAMRGVADSAHRPYFSPSRRHSTNLKTVLDPLQSVL